MKLIHCLVTMKISLKTIVGLLLIFNICEVRCQWDTPKDATRGQFPHQVSLEWHNQPISPPQHLCGGVILNEFWVLSSGHCITRFQVGILRVKVGRHDIAADDEHVQTLDIAKKIINPKYPGLHHMANLGVYDISLIKTTTPMTFNDRVKPAKLPKKDTLLSGQKLEYNLIFSGWGSIANLVLENRPTILQTINVPVVENRICDDAINHVIHNFHLHHSQMCTRPLDGSISACIGDHGGPLIQYDKHHRPIVIGILAFCTLNCNTNNLPPVYSMVGSSLSWIKKTMKKS